MSKTYADKRFAELNKLAAEFSGATKAAERASQAFYAAFTPVTQRIADIINSKSHSKKNLGLLAKDAALCLALGKDYDLINGAVGANNGPAITTLINVGYKTKYNHIYDAVRKNYPYALKALIEGGADIHELSKPRSIDAGDDCYSVTGYETFLHKAASPHRYEVARLLLEAGLNPNTQSLHIPADEYNGKYENFKPHATALHCAAYYWQGAEMVKLLMKFGADPSIKDAYGRTAYDSASPDLQPFLAKLFGQVQASEPQTPSQ